MLGLHGPSDFAISHLTKSNLSNFVDVLNNMETNLLLDDGKQTDKHQGNNQKNWGNDVERLEAIERSLSYVFHGSDVQGNSYEMSWL